MGSANYCLTRIVVLAPGLVLKIINDSKIKRKEKSKHGLRRLYGVQHRMAGVRNQCLGGDMQELGLLG